MRGVVLSWNNCVDGNIRLVSDAFVFPAMPFPNLIRMWYCGDIANNVPPYKMLQAIDVKHIKFGSQKLSNMRTLVHHVERAARLTNKAHLLRRNYKVEDTLV